MSLITSDKSIYQKIEHLKSLINCKEDYNGPKFDYKRGKDGWSSFCLVLGS